ncbi:hypothetical protein MMC19_002657 [Ptychographa xylographoides]|nr:hypothetical protein [Ptychographa xylographoides]
MNSPTQSDGDTTISMFRVRRITRSNPGFSPVVPDEVWCSIFEMAHPRDLFAAKATCHYFHEILQPDTIWKKAREHFYGPDCPGAPAGMTEKAYAHLLHMRGCQESGCGKKGIRKVYWIRRQRLCEACFEKRAMSDQCVRTLVRFYPRLKDCLMWYTVDGWQKYVRTGQTVLVGRETNIAYDKPTVLRTIDQIDALQVQPRDVQAKWYNDQREIRNNTMMTLEICEMFFLDYNKKQIRETRDARTEMVQYFEEEAAKMDPSLSKAILHACPSYQKKIAKVARISLATAWRELKPKLIMERAEATNTLAVKDMASKRLTDQLNQNQAFNARRKNQDTPEILEVINQTARALDDLELGESEGVIKDPDLVPHVLNQVYRGFNQVCLDPELRRNVIVEGIGPWELKMDDAEIVVGMFIDHADGNISAERMKAVFDEHRCMPCSRRGVKENYHFWALMYHIVKEHAKADDPEFACWAGESVDRWGMIKWPRNLPILSKTRRAPLHWDPDDDSEFPYVHADEKDVSTNVKQDDEEPDPMELDDVDPLAQRQVSLIGPESTDFVANVFHGIRQMQSCTLAPKLKTFVIYEYARQRYELNNPHAMVSVDEWVVLQLQLVKQGHEDLFNGFRCPVCMNGLSRARFGRTDQSLGNLIGHHNFKHRSFTPLRFGRHQLFNFPPKYELVREMMRHDAVREAVDALFPLIVYNGNVAPVCPRMSSVR